MNRRDLLRRAFAVGAAGLMLPVVEPARKVWALDRTMVPEYFVPSGGSGDRGYEINEYMEYMRVKKELEDRLLYGPGSQGGPVGRPIESEFVWSRQDMVVSGGRWQKYDRLYIGGENMWVQEVKPHPMSDHYTLTVLRGPVS